MPATWTFNRSFPSDVDMEVTQMEQFDNDEIGLGNSLVREVIQNSMDAKNSIEPVRVNFTIRELSELGTLKVKLLREILKPVEDHLVASGLPIPDDKSVRLLCVEDFNTSGLTGKFDEKDGENFSNFWRVMGKSQKKGEAGGRRGLGKLVFSAASKIRTFFGVTRRAGDNDLFAMGQVILKTHNIGPLKFKPHGFWHDDCWNDQEDLQLPTNDESEMENIRFVSGFKRTTESGFSILIPYLRDNITERVLIENVLENYYFSILSNQLVVNVNKTVIDTDSFEKVYKKSKHTKAAIPLDFISSVSKMLKLNSDAIRSNTIDLKKFPNNLFSKNDVEYLRDRYNKNEIIHVVVPIPLREKDENFDYKGEYNLFLRSLKNNRSAFKFFARGPITLLGERRQFNGNCQAGFIAETGKIAASFLGDAENPSHTQWNSNAELLRERWHAPQRPLKIMRDSLQELFNLVAKQEESKDNDVLSRFFSVHKPSNAKGSDFPKENLGQAEGKNSSSSVEQLGFKIIRIEKGLAIEPDGSLDVEKIPKKIRVEMAFSRKGGNALGNYEKLDFDLNDPTTIEYDCINGKCEVYESNVLDVEVNGKNFSLSVTLMDLNRDLFVKASVLNA